MTEEGPGEVESTGRPEAGEADNADTEETEEAEYTRGAGQARNEKRARAFVGELARRSDGRR